MLFWAHSWILNINVNLLLDPIRQHGEVTECLHCGIEFA